MSRVSGEFELWPERERTLGWLEWKFGMPPEAFDEWAIWHRPGVPSLWIAHRLTEPRPEAGIELIGLLFMRDPPPRGFPSTSFLQRFGHLARERIIDVPESDVVALVFRDPVPLTTEMDDGVVVVRGPHGVLGRGWVKAGQLTLDFPKSRRQRMERPS